MLIEAKNLIGTIKLESGFQISLVGENTLEAQTVKKKKPKQTNKKTCWMQRILHQHIRSDQAKKGGQLSSLTLSVSDYLVFQKLEISMEQFFHTAVEHLDLLLLYLNH